MRDVQLRSVVGALVDALVVEAREGVSVAAASPCTARTDAAAAAPAVAATAAAPAVAGTAAAPAVAATAAAPAVAAAVVAPAQAAIPIRADVAPAKVVGAMAQDLRTIISSTLPSHLMSPSNESRRPLFYRAIDANARALAAERVLAGPPMRLSSRFRGDIDGGILSSIPKGPSRAISLGPSVAEAAEAVKTSETTGECANEAPLSEPAVINTIYARAKTPDWIESSSSSDDEGFFLRRNEVSDIGTVERAPAVTVLQLPPPPPPPSRPRRKLRCPPSIPAAATMQTSIVANLLPPTLPEPPRDLDASLSALAIQQLFPEPPESSHETDALKATHPSDTIASIALSLEGSDMGDAPPVFV